jgi:periplasmic divalent cation tolerance protein
MTELCEVVITAPDPQLAELLQPGDGRAATCASAYIFAPVQSIYRWRSDIYERTEGWVSLHARRD